jgi:hypothetical protein
MSLRHHATPLYLFTPHPQVSVGSQSVAGEDVFNYPVGPVVDRVEGCRDAGNETLACPTSGLHRQG